MAFDVDKVRAAFPILGKKVYEKPLVYLDNAATTQKPQCVIDRITHYYENENCNIHRGVHHLSQMATMAFESCREHVARFINAPQKEEIIFTKGTTESINLVAASYGRKFLEENDEVIITGMEHHSNLVPWQMLCHEKKARLRVVPFNDHGELDMPAYRKMLGEKTRIVAITHISNALGTVNPVKEMIDLAHRQNVPVLVDGAQAISHMKVDMQELGCDFYCFSGHKAYAPMGVGVLYGRMSLLESMNPYQTGGEMVESVSLFETVFNEIPLRFEAGTPNVEAVLGLDTAISFLEETGMENIYEYESRLLAYATKKLQSIRDARIIGTARNKAGVLSFLIGDIHPYDAGTIIDKFGIAVRTGHHCAQPVMDRYGISGTLRASLAIYNTKDDIDKLVEAIHQTRKMFS